MIEKIENGRISLEIPIFEILGIPDPEKHSPMAGELNIPGQPTLGSPTTLWIKANWFWLVIVGLLIIVLFATK